MPLESAPQSPLGRIDVQSLAPRPEAIVTPEAIAAQANAFRGGVADANQAFDRSRMAPVIAAQVAQATDPAILAAQKEAILQKAQQEQLQTQAGQLQLQQAQALAKIPPVVQTMQQELAKTGLQVATTPQQWSEKDSAEVYERWRGVEEWKTAKASADAALQIVKPQEVERGGKKMIVPINEKTAQPVQPQQVTAIQEWNEQNKTPQQFIRNGKPAAPSLFGAIAPGAAATAPTGEGMVINDTAKAPTEGQVKAGNFSARALTADQVFDNLTKAGYNPASTANWAQEFLIGPFAALRSADKRSYDAAKNSWLQGLLRLESGAAISAKEQSWYEKVFFPTVGDPPEVQAQKQQMRSDVEKIADAVAKGGQLDVPALLQIEQRTSGGNAANPSATSNSQKTISVSGVGTGYLDLSDPSNPRFVVTGGAASGGSTNYEPPATLRKTSTRPKVEPKEMEPKSRSQRF